MTTLTVGLTAEITITVGEHDTAAAFASGAVPVLATPRLIGLMEQAAAAAVQPTLALEQTTVGTRVDVRHIAATPIGMRVTARAELIEVVGRILRFRVEARDTQELVSEGLHERAIVDHDRFLERVAKKASS
jgi:fluoroacetyl-CoA thioesterase